MSAAPYRTPIVAAPGVVFHTVRGFAIGILVFVALLSAMHCVGLLAGVACMRWFAESTCTGFDPGPLVAAIGVSDELQRDVVHFPIEVTASIVVCAVVAIALLRPITVLLDTSTRSLVIRSGRWPRRIRTRRVSLADIDTIEVDGVAGTLFAVRVFDVRGERHDLTGYWLRHARATAIAEVIQSATG